MTETTVVGSGASGVHFALSLLQKGHRVTMLDLGNTGPGMVNPHDSFADLKRNLSDPVSYFLGREFEGVVPPDSDKEVYGFPPNKLYIFEVPHGFEVETQGFEPLFSFARGGLAEAWTGGCYPFNDDDLERYPFSYADILPHYNTVSGRVGIIGDRDDLARFFPHHDHLLPPLELDEHSRLLVEGYTRRRETLQKRLGMFLGRSRIATLSQDRDGRKACDYSGRCLWGCPSHSLYVPSLTLEACLKYDRFTYVPGVRVSHFLYGENRRVHSIVGERLPSGEIVAWPVKNLVLAAGTLSSAKIFLDSLFVGQKEIRTLTGLMDNRQVLMPFASLRMVGRRYDPKTYQYHQLAVGFFDRDGRDYIHGQITTVKTALMQPAIQQIPMDLRTAAFVVRNFHAALGVININFPDFRREDNTVTIRPRDGARSRLPDTELVIRYTPPQGEEERIGWAMGRVKKFLGKLGALVPPGMSHVRPMGASVHYSGLLPMSAEKGPNRVTPSCRSHDFENLFLVDGISFPFLPAKNLTFTLMANAVRVADLEFSQAR